MEHFTLGKACELNGSIVFLFPMKPFFERELRLNVLGRTVTIDCSNVQLINPVREFQDIACIYRKFGSSKDGKNLCQYLIPSAAKFNGSNNEFRLLQEINDSKHCTRFCQTWPPILTSKDRIGPQNRKHNAKCLKIYQIQT